MAPPAFSDLAKPANDLINKDFYHGNASLFEVKLRSPDGLSIVTKGVSPHEHHISASVEAKKTIQKGEDPISNSPNDEADGGAPFIWRGMTLRRSIQTGWDKLKCAIHVQCSPVHVEYGKQRAADVGSQQPDVTHRSENMPLVPSSIAATSSLEPTMPGDNSTALEGASWPSAYIYLKERSRRFPIPQSTTNVSGDVSFTNEVSKTPHYIEFDMRTRATLIARLKLPDLGITATGNWNSASALNTKIELEDILAAGVKAEYVGNFHPKTGLKAQKAALYFRQGAFHTRAFAEYTPATGNVYAVVDGVVAHEGFLVGGEAGFDVQKAALTRYAAAFAYTTPVYSAAITATNNLSVYHAHLYQRVSPFVEAGVKTGYDTKSNTSTGIEIATKYKIDPTAFAKVKVNDRGIISLAYNAKINAGLTFGIGVSLDAQKLNEAGHKIGTSFVFEG